MLLSRAVAGRLVAAGTGHVHVSLDGATAATYEDVRHGVGEAPRPGQFERVVRNLRGLVAARGEARRPRLVVVFVAMRRNLGELDAGGPRRRASAVDEVWVQNLSHVFSDTDGLRVLTEIRRYAESEACSPTSAGAGACLSFGAARLVPRRSAEAAAARTAEAARRGCSWPWDGAYVTHRGSVQPCCMVMGSDRATLGRWASAFPKIWRGGRDAYRGSARAALQGAAGRVRGCSQYRGVF